MGGPYGPLVSDAAWAASHLPAGFSMEICVHIEGCWRILKQTCNLITIFRRKSTNSILLIFPICPSPIPLYNIVVRYNSVVRYTIVRYPAKVGQNPEHWFCIFVTPVTLVAPPRNISIGHSHRCLCVGWISEYLLSSNVLFENIFLVSVWNWAF